MKKVKVRTGNNELLTNVLKGSFVAISITLVCILLFALIIKLTNLSDSVIMPINQFIKIISIFFGVKCATKHVKEKGLLKGALIGLIYTILSFLIFAALSRTFPISFTLFYDALFSMVIGAICGIFTVNLRK